MALIKGLTKESAGKLLVELLNECFQKPEEPYDSKFDRAKLARIRQSIKILEIFILHQEYQEVLSRVKDIEKLIVQIDDVTHDIKEEVWAERQANEAADNA